MAILKPTEIYGVVRYLGVNPDRGGGLRSQARERVEVDFAGFQGEAHGGLTRPACTRVKLQYPKGAEIRNTRQLSIVSLEELEAVAEAMGAPSALAPNWIGANLMLSGVPDLTLAPPASRLIFEDGASLVVDMQNAPCKIAAAELEAEWPGVGLSFPKHARDRRGVTAWVERPGAIALGARCRLHVPPQRIYAPASA